MLLCALPGCGQHAASRPALTDKDRTILARYEEIRAALAIDDYRAANRAAKDLLKYLKPTDDAPSTPLTSATQDLVAAVNMDKAHLAFRAMSVEVIPLADGVQGYYIMNSPLPSGAEWVQTTTKVDNPYVGKTMRDVGSLRK